MQCGSLSVGVKLSGAGRNRDASAVLGRSRKTLHDHAIPHSPRSQRLNYGDKENIYPKDVQVLKAAASKPCKGWRPTLDKNQLSLRPAAEYRERQCLRQQKVFKRLLRPFRSEAVGKSRFHPPVPSKRSSTCNVESSGRLAVSRSEKEKKIAFDVQPFVYQEVMKISLSSLMALYKDCILAEADSDLFRRQILDIITAENAVDVRFTGNNGLVGFSDNNVDDGQPIGPRDLYHQLRARKHIWKKMGATFAWFLNHYRWVVWKLAATERSFPRLLLGKYLTKDQVVRQIAYRYQHDVTDAKRSILKKILNRDASSLSCVVLCIAAVLPYPADLQNDPIDQECPACFNLALVLTDGWYSVYAVPDAPLATVLWNLHAKSSIIGTKIAAWNALLQNSVEGIDPLECAIVCESQWKHPLVAREDLTRWPYLRLRYNSTRRVRFDTRLGVERLHHAVSSNSMQYKQQPQLQFSLLKSVPLKCLEVGGGMVRSVRVRVTRISSVLHLQAKDWTVGPRILCDDQLPLYFQLRSEYARAAMLKNHKQNGVDIVENDCLDHDQDNAPPPIPFIKVDVECTHICADYNCGLGYGILTIWRPSEELLCGGIKEGVEYFVSKLNVRWKFDGGRSHDAYVQLSSTRHSTFEEVCNIISSTGDGKKSNAKLKRGERICVDIQQATDRYWSTLEDGLSGYGNDWRPKVDVCVYVVLVTAPVTQDDSTAAAKRHQEASLLDPAIRPVESRYVKHVFVTDQSCRLMSIRVTGTNVSMPKLRHYSPSTCASSSSFVFCRGNKDVWKEGSIICLSGLEISHYDEHLDVLDCILVESTQIVSSPSKRSLFWERFSLLHCEAGISAKHLFAAQALPPFGSFAEKLALLKKHVERDILGIDLAPSQSCNEHYATLVEQKRHGRDRWPQEGGADATGTARTDQAVSKSSRLSWKASVFKITLLTGNSRFMFPSGVIASACVNVGTDDVAYRTVYLTRKVLFSMEALLLQAGMFCREGDGFIDTKHEDTVLVDTISKVLRQPEMNYLFRFEVSRIENECLAGSWKPWEHLHALYWLAETVTAG
uniref:BRCA2 OB1 domain-containing protein n=1 Tax=Hyaloperonospora arabidopsidis (strain Emoy2) TaxID=559515 RepID=M4C6C4_HYAAE